MLSALILVGPGYYPPMMHRLQMPEEGLGQWMEGSHDSGPHSPEVLAKVKGMGTLQIRGATKSNLISQAIPIYGFGILLYILFIIFKVSCTMSTLDWLSQMDRQTI